MLEIEEKQGALKAKINQIRSHYDVTQIGLHSSIDQVETLLDTSVARAGSLVKNQMSDVRMTTAAQCLGLQLPIPDIDGAMDQFTQAVKHLGRGTFLDSMATLVDELVSGGSVATALEKIKNIAAILEDKVTGLDSLEGVFDSFAKVQDAMQRAQATVSIFLGCMGGGQNPSGHLDAIDDVLARTNGNFRAGMDAVQESKIHFTKPGEILADAKARVTGKLDLDGQMTAVKDGFTTALEGFI